MNTFDRIYKENLWGSSESLSGGGSTLWSTRQIRIDLPILFKKLGIKTLLDAPCGDLNWISTMDLNGINYIGADIVPALIANSRKKHPDRDLRVLNIVSDPLPSADLILCRDCLGHLCFTEIFLALHNMIRSGSRYLLTTHFAVTVTDKNRDIRTGGWRPINLEKEPFHLPPPGEILLEHFKSKKGQFEDKSLALWDLHSLTPMMSNSQQYARQLLM